MNEFEQRVMALTVPCADDGVSFLRTERIDRIAAILADSDYAMFGRRPLSHIYRHREYSDEKPTILVSSHVDSLYGQYFAARCGDDFQGTLDNSACNALVVELMKQGGLPVQVLVAFTGDEENGSAGVDQTMAILRENRASFLNLELVVVLDLTEEFYGICHFTVENYFIGSPRRKRLLQFFRRREMRTFINRCLGCTPPSVKDGDPDESWQYDEYDLNCFTLCLPCGLIGDDMHSDLGVTVKGESFLQYAGALQRLTAATHDYLADRALRRATGATSSGQGIDPPATR